MRLRLPAAQFPVFLLFASLLLATPSEATKKPPSAPININMASAEELQQVPGIGPVTAEKIIKMRKARGHFKSVNELRAIKGIGPKRLAKMKPYLTVGDSPAAEKSASAPSKPVPPQ